MSGGEGRNSGFTIYFLPIVFSVKLSQVFPVIDFIYNVSSDTIIHYDQVYSNEICFRSP
jgi:hypothetical protein